MPNVGRQVMQGGGVPEDVAINPFADIVLPPEEKDDKPRDYRQPLGERVREGISKGFGEQRLGLKLEEQQRYDPTGIIQNMVAVPLDFAIRAPGAVIGGLAGLGAGLYGKLPGVDETQTNKMQRDLKVLGDVIGMEAGNVRPRAPTDVSSIPRSGEVLPPNPPMAIPRALEIAREVRERPPINPDGTPSAPQPPLPTVREPTAPVREPTAPVQAPPETIDMSRRGFLQGMGAAAGSAALPKGTLPALLNEPKAPAAVYDVSRVSSLMSDMLGQKIPITDNVNLGKYVDVGALAENVQEYPTIYGVTETPEGLLNPGISRWEMISPDYSRLFADNFYSGDQSLHRMSADSVAALKAEMEAKLGYKIPEEDFRNALKDQLKSQIEIHELKHDMYLTAAEGLDPDLILDGMKARARAAAYSAPDKPKARDFLDSLGKVTPEEILEKAYGIPKDRVQAVLDEPIARSFEDGDVTTLRDHLESIYSEASDWWWEEISPSEKREIRKAWNDEVKKMGPREAPVETTPAAKKPPNEEAISSYFNTNVFQYESSGSLEEAKAALKKGLKKYPGTDVDALRKKYWESNLEYHRNRIPEIDKYLAEMLKEYDQNPESVRHIYKSRDEILANFKRWRGEEERFINKALENLAKISNTEETLPRGPAQQSLAFEEAKPPTIDELRQVQAQAKQAFEDAKAAIQADRTNPELKAQVAQRQKELMAATKEVEKAESTREPKPGATSNVPREPEYVPPRSEMGLYSYAAEVAAKARQAGKPEDLIAWLKAQPGVKLEELREAGAVRSDGSYNPSFAPDIKKMTPNELAERLSAAVPEVRDFVRYDTKEIPVNNVGELKEMLLNNEEMWRQVMSGDFRGYNSFADGFERKEFLNRLDVDDYLNNVIDSTEGRIKIRGDAEYGPSKTPDLSTPGGTNYREIPLSLTPYDETPPTRVVMNGPFHSGTFATMDDAYKKLDELRERAKQVFGDDPQQLEVVLGNIDRTRLFEEIEPSFKTRNIMSYGHMSDVPNNLAWLRVQDVAATKPDGKALRVEETQSDISQKGRGKGFRMSPEELEEFKAKTDVKAEEYKRLGTQSDDEYYKWKEKNRGRSLPEGSTLYKTFLKENPEQKKLNDYLDKLRQEIYDEANRVRDNDAALPRLPYMEETQQWTDLTTKRALIEAAKGNYTELQFITGDINRRRYEGYEGGDAGYHYDVNIPSSLKRVLKTIDPDAKIEKISIEPEKTKRYLREKANLEESIDYYNNRIDELHKRMKGMIPDDPAYRNLEMEIDGILGMIENYDKELKVLDKSQEFWSVEITPKMREKILQGLPRFAIGGAVTHMTVEEFAKALEE
jgi:hypothetical protein